MKRITVFCGARAGADTIYLEQATELGRTLAKQNIGLVYGGAHLGLMGAIANGALMENGHVIGVIPNFLETREVSHRGLTELITVESMHERKAKMNELSDAVIALPGGFGTLEELFEMLTWVQLGLNKKPIGILNIDGYFDALIAFLQTMVDKLFLKEIDKDRLIVSDNIDDLLNKMRNYTAPTVQALINRETT